MIITRTPFRISFFGGGTDYPVWYKEHGGKVLSATVNKYCYISCRTLPPFFEHKTRIVWSKIEAVKNLEEIQHPSVRACLAFTKTNRGLEIHHDADLPARSGLGSSSAFTVGLLHALHALEGKMITKRQLALDTIHVEQHMLQENVGSQDQVAASFGGFNLIHFGGPQHITVHPIVLPPTRLEDFQNHLMMFFTGISRTASHVAKEQIANTPARLNELNTMAGLVDEAIDVLKSDKPLSEFGALLDETWKLKKSLSSQISNPTIDGIYETGKKAGAFGGKLLGAGGGGFILFFVDPGKKHQLLESLKNLLHVPIRFEYVGSQIIYYGPEMHTTFN